MSLPNGYYNITSQAGNPIGRGIVEDRSFRPKRVVSLPKDFTDPRIWHFEQLADGKYKLTTGPGKAVVGTLPDKVVWAFLLEEDIQGAEWRITHVPQHGENAYIIETPDKTTGEGWVAYEEENSQVAVKPLVATRSIPPFFLPTEVFDIVPVPAPE